jgi:hypothetical protein
MATETRNEGSSFRFGAQQHHALLIVGLVEVVKHRQNKEGRQQQEQQNKG